MRVECSYSRSVGDVRVERAFLGEQLLPERVALQHALQCGCVVSRDLLLHVQDGDVGRDAQAAARQHLQQRGLTQAVPPDQSIPAAARQAQLGSLQQRPAARANTDRRLSTPVGTMCAHTFHKQSQISHDAQEA